MCPPLSRVQRSRHPESVRHIRRPNAARARERTQARIRFLTGAIVLGASGADSWIGVLVASEHPGAAAPAPPPQPGTPGSTVSPTTPATTVSPTTTDRALATTTTTTTVPPTRTTTRPVVTSGGSSRRWKATIQRISALRRMEISLETYQFGLRPAALAPKMTAKPLAEKGRP
jgi:hypothetical protein